MKHLKLFEEINAPDRTLYNSYQKYYSLYNNMMRAKEDVSEIEEIIDHLDAISYSADTKGAGGVPRRELIGLYLAQYAVQYLRQDVLLCLHEKGLIPPAQLDNLIHRVRYGYYGNKNDKKSMMEFLKRIKNS